MSRDLAGLIRRVEGLEANVPRRLSRILVEAAETGEADARARAGSLLRRRTGRLAASIEGTATASGMTLAARHPAGRIHDRGGTIQPRKGALLRVPIGAQGGRGRVVRAKSGRLVVVGRGGVQAVLLPSVTHRPRLYLTGAMIAARERVRDALPTVIRER